MHLITPATGGPLYSVSATRQAERLAAGQLPAHALMRRAGRSAARLALALAPHTHHVWVACGPRNNGGDGFEAAAWLRRAGKSVTLTWTGVDAGKVFAADAQASMQGALDEGLVISETPPRHFDFCIDALLGIGGKGMRGNEAPTPSAARLAQWLTLIRNTAAPVLAIDVPSGLDADTGTDFAQEAASETAAASCTAQAVKSRPGPRYTLSMLTLKPGLFTASGRDLAGEIWLDRLDGREQFHETVRDTLNQLTPVASLSVPDDRPGRHAAAHASHKGSFGDVAVIGGETRGGSSMAGAALLAARAALHAGAGRVMVSLLGEAPAGIDASQPELMFRALEALDLSRQAVVCGCGGGQSTAGVLPRVLSSASRCVLDADALNNIAADSALAQFLYARHNRGYRTVITPHPLEAARLLACSAETVQRDRLAAATALAARFQCTVVLKGSGTVILTPDQLPLINPTGNALLAAPGTGDVLAGMVGAALARGLAAHEAAQAAVYAHGAIADCWPSQHPGEALTASGLARAIRPF